MAGAPQMACVPEQDIRINVLVSHSSGASNQTLAEGLAGTRGAFRSNMPKQGRRRRSSQPAAAEVAEPRARSLSRRAADGPPGPDQACADLARSSGRQPVLVADQPVGRPARIEVDLDFHVLRDRDQRSPVVDEHLAGFVDGVDVGVVAVALVGEFSSVESCSCPCRSRDR